MANQYFETFDDVLNYREDCLSFNMVDLYKACHLLRSVVKKDDTGFYRSNKSVPLIRSGDVIVIKIGEEFVLKSYDVSLDNQYPVVTFEELLDMDYAVYRKDTINEIIPPIKKKNRKALYSNQPIVPNNFVRALQSVFGVLIEDVIGKEHVVDYSYELKDLLTIAKGTSVDLKQEALNHLYMEQVKTGNRFPITDELINETVDKFEKEYDTLVTNIIEEVNNATYNSISSFVSERPCSRYHFNEEGSIFLIERGMDTRIFKWETEKFEKLGSIEDAAGLPIEKFVAPWKSAKYDLY